MASEDCKGSRVTLVLENLQDIKSSKCDEQQLLEGCRGRMVVEHMVLFNMPYLQGDQEAKILQGLYNLQFEFDNALELVVGRVLTKQKVCTHALIVRFSSIEVLLKYYQSDALSNIGAKIRPHLHGSYTCDYQSPRTHGFKVSEKEGKWVSLAVLQMKKDILDIFPAEVDCYLKELSETVHDLCFIKDFSLGSNLCVKDTTYTHAFAAYSNSVQSLEKLSSNPSYRAVLYEKLLPLCCETLQLKFVSFKPIMCAL